MITNIKTLLDAQRIVSELEKRIIDLEEKQDPTSTGEESEIEGEIGSLRVIKNEENENLFEIKTEDGWKRPVVGNTPVTFKRLEDVSKSKTKKSIDELESSDDTTGGTEAKNTIYDEKDGKFILPRADYDSGWTANASDNAATTLEHSLETINFSIIDIQVSNSSTGSNATWVNAGTNLNDANKFGYIVQVVDSNNIKVGIGESGAAKFHCNGLEWENTEATHFRLRLWK